MLRISHGSTVACARRSISLAVALALAAPPVFAVDPLVVGRNATEKNAVAEAAPENVEAQDLAAASDYVDANGAGDGSDAAVADGANAVAVGPASYAFGENAAAFGFGSAALGNDSTAVGPFSLALGSGASAFGFGSSALGDYSTALGYGSSASGYTSLAFGYNASSNGNGAIAIGGEAVLELSWDQGTALFVTRADGLLSTAVGPGAQADGAVSVAIGAGAQALDDLGVAIGHRAQASFKAVAIGNEALANEYNGVALGNETKALGPYSVALGGIAYAEETHTTAVGFGSRANGYQATAIGAYALAWSPVSLAVGNGATAEAMYSTAIGYQARSWGTGSIAMGMQAVAGGLRPVKEPPPPSCTDPDDPDCGPIGWPREPSTADFEMPEFAIAVGQGAQAFGFASMALGYHSLTLSENSVALGAGSLADRDNVVSVGASQSWLRNDGSTVAAFTRQIINVAAGTEDYDAMNVGQGGALAAAFGGGASFVNGAMVAPTYHIQGGSYGDVGATFAAVDAKLTGLQQAIDGIEVPPTDPVDPPPVDPTDPGEGTDGNDIAYDDTTQDSVTLGGNNGTQVKNVANGVATKDAVNKGQMEQADAATLATANQYADSVGAKTLTSANQYTDQRIAAINDQFVDLSREVDRRLHRQDERIDQMGAMSAAMMSMSINAANGRSERGRFAVGAGVQNSQSALSVGYSKSFGNASFSIGGAFTDQDSSAGVGFGIDL